MRKELGIKIVKIFSLDKKLLQFSKEQKIAKELNTLHSGMDNEKQLYREYLGNKIGYIFCGFVCIWILLLAFWLKPEDKGEIQGNAILRNGYEEAEKSIVLIAKSEGMEEEIEVLLEPLHYSKEQLDIMAEEVFLYFSDTFFSKNGLNEDNQYVINEHMKFPAKLEGYPFLITWESSNYNAMDNDGTIMEKISDKGENVRITAKLTYFDYIWEKEYACLVFPVVVNWEESFSDEVEKSIEELDNLTSDEQEFLLPQVIDGHKIVYEEKSENSYGLLVGLGIVVLLFIWISVDSNLSKQLENRNNQLLVDYAKLVSKLSLYLGAGLSFRTAISRIVEGADKKRFYARELEITARELENGIAESKAIENFAERCQLPCYIKLAVLINQNIWKGNNSLQKQLKEEVDKAFEGRKNLARKYGEEAGTKLLFPMLLMLVVVMVMIMYPAFVSFTV